MVRPSAIVIVGLLSLAAVMETANARELAPCMCEGLTMNCGNGARRVIGLGEICRGIIAVNLRGNEFQDMPEGFLDVLEVDLSQNYLRSLPNPKKLNKTLRFLDVSRNEIHWPGNGIVAMDKLQTLYASQNRISSLEFLPRPCKLHVLDVSANLISNIRGHLEDCELLETLKIAHNSLITIPEGVLARFPRLRVLDITSNGIMQICGGLFEGLNNLQHLNLSNNKLIALPASTFSKMHILKEIDLSGNALTHVFPSTFQGLDRLESLKMKVVQTTAFPYEMFNRTLQLQSLVLDIGDLTSIPKDILKPLHQLQDLKIVGKQLHKLPDGMLSNQLQMKSVTVVGSQLTEIQDDLFSGKHFLSSLDLRSNRLRKLPELKNCCDFLRFADFSENNITVTSEAAVRGLLRGGLSEDEVAEGSGEDKNEELGKSERNSEGNSDTEDEDRDEREEESTHEYERRYGRENEAEGQGENESDEGYRVIVHLRNNPLQADALLWAARAPDFRHYVDKKNCKCGGLQHGAAKMDFCIETKCNPKADFRNWMSAVRASADALDK